MLAGFIFTQPAESICIHALDFAGFFPQKTSSEAFIW